ncbi:MAG: hypothetical protein D3923_08730 [Candidatus Electrothrix sp. AR3]|nr:hypothetical protein [Candidatus Electrothrix sp. AR3]
MIGEEIPSSSGDTSLHINVSLYIWTNLADEHNQHAYSEELPLNLMNGAERKKMLPPRVKLLDSPSERV